MSNDPELSPDDDDWVPPSADGSPREQPRKKHAAGSSHPGDSSNNAGSSQAPLDTKPYQPELTPLEVAKYVKPVDHTSGVGGYGPAPGASRRVQLTELTLAEEVDLLAKNNIYVNPASSGAGGTAGYGIMAAYVVGGSLEPARKLAVRFKKVSLRPPTREREDSVTYSYDEFESHLQRQLVSSSKIGFGIPMLFRVDATHTYATSSATHINDVRIHFAASQLIPKALATFDVEDLEVDPGFVERVSAIVNSNKVARQKAEALLTDLNDYGHFVPLSVMLGGRISLRQVTELKNKSNFESTKNTFDVAANARFRVNGVPVEGGAGTAVGQWGTSDQNVIQQAKSLLMELRGGDERLASSNPEALGSKWIDSLGPYKDWRTIGFSERSLVPIIDFLPQKLRDDCTTLLRSYFTQNLDVRHSEVVGHASDNAFSSDRLTNSSGKPLRGELAKQTRGLSEIVVNAEGNVDALKLSYNIYMPGSGTSWPTDVYAATFGTHRGDRFDAPAIRLSLGETITAIEAWVDPRHDGGVVRRIAFRTNRGARYPDATGFYGRNHEPHDELRVIEAPRVRALRGFSGSWVHCIGLTYLDLSANVRSRQYLMTMEPFLFPTGNYGPLP